METLFGSYLENTWSSAPRNDCIHVRDDDDDDCLHVRMHLPAAADDELRIVVDGMCLRIEVDRKRAEDFQDVCCADPCFGKGEWYVALPEEVEPHVQHRRELGVLLIRLVKKARQGRQFEN